MRCMTNNGRAPATARAARFEPGTRWAVTTRGLVKACLVLTPLACASPPHAKAPQPPRISAPSSGAVDDQPLTQPAEAPAKAPAAVPPALRRFATSVDALDGPPDSSHQNVVQALRAAAGALQSIDHAPRAPDDSGLSTAAARIESSAPDSKSHADDVLTGLQAAQRRLRTLQVEPSRTPAFQAALAALDEQVTAMGSERPLLDQRPTTARAFRALADAVFLAAGQDAPFGGQSRSMLAARSVDELMKQLRSDTSALASADLTTVRTRAADALLSLADLVSRLGRASRGAEDAKEIIFQAERLRREESAPFARSQWVERGLLAALQTLDSLETCHPDRIDDWVKTAQRAATELPEHGTLSFQHARVQDAFRATVDAFGVALLDPGSCAGKAGTAGLR
jgi:hypothetical protein